jgi:hypothetical protein
MNLLLLVAGALAALTAVVHLIAGHLDTERPLLASSLADVPKRTLHGCWHIASVAQVVSAATLLYAGSAGNDGTDALSRFIAVNYLGFGLVFFAIALTAGTPRRFVVLPQWAALLPIAALAWAATL